MCCCKTSCEFLAAIWIKHRNQSAKQSVWFQKQTHSKCGKILLNSEICRQKWVISECPKDSHHHYLSQHTSMENIRQGSAGSCSLWVTSNLSLLRSPGTFQRRKILWFGSHPYSTQCTPIPEIQELSIPCPRLAKCVFLHCCVFKAVLPHCHLPSWNYSPFTSGFIKFSRCSRSAA